MLKRISAPALTVLSRVGNSVCPERNRYPLIISGSPRGGTTWVAESVAKIFNTRRILWEPLQGGNIASKGLHFSARPWVCSDTTSPEVDDFFDSLISGKLANAHLIRLRKYPRNILSLLDDTRPVIKFVRGNGVVGYLRRRFDIPRPLVVMRHPCAVVASQLNMGEWQDHPHIDMRLLDRHPHLKNFVTQNAPLHQRLAMTWAGDVLAARANSADVHLVHYEDLVLRGAEVMLPVLRSWGFKDLPPRFNEILSIPSSTSHGWSSLSTSHAKLHNWKKHLSNEMVADILGVARSMGVEDYSE